MDLKIDFSIKVQNFEEVIEQLRGILNNSVAENSIIEQNLIPSRDKQQLNVINKEITFDEVRDKIGILTNNGKMTLAKQILAKYNAQKISDVKIEDYENLYTEITKLLN